MGGGGGVIIIQHCFYSVPGGKCSVKSKIALPDLQTSSDPAVIKDFLPDKLYCVIG